jgi:hypothetical protein
MDPVLMTASQVSLNSPPINGLSSLDILSLLKDFGSDVRGPKVTEDNAFKFGTTALR